MSDEEAEAARPAEEQLDEFTARLDEEEARRLKAEALAEQRRARREAKADREFRSRLEAEARQEMQARQTEEERVAEAMLTIEEADPELLLRLRCARAVQGVPFLDQRASPPSLGGQPPGTMELLERQQRSAEMAWQNELAARERWLADQEDVINRLCAGQTPDNQRQIRAQFAAQARR